MKKILTASLAMSMLATTSLISLQAAANETGWTPTISEKILILPPKHLETAIEQDFDRSPLATELGSLEQTINGQVSFLTQLQSDLDLYQGQEQLEARHQLISGKRDYIQLMGEQIQLKKKRLEVKLDIYNRLLRKSKQSAYENSQSAQFDEVHAAVADRAANVDSSLRDDLFTSSMMPETEFAQAYAENQSAISQLVEAIESHPSNHAGGSIDGDQMSREDELRLSMQDIQSKLAILAMEEDVLGHMAKLVSLDAQAFADDLNEFQYGVDGFEPKIYDSPANNIQLFINRS
ncbi:MAG: hypothetical protein ISQ21_07575 [Alphaproteobacteria bacterium]|nr:hypothetical protein [Alphaproteobacteria bacterium]